MPNHDLVATWEAHSRHDFEPETSTPLTATYRACLFGAAVSAHAKRRKAVLRP